MEKREELYRGKAKSVYQTDDADRLILLFRNDTSAFDGKRIEQLDRKGAVNNKFNAFIMQKLEAAGIPTQFEDAWTAGESLARAVVRRIEDPDAPLLQELDTCPAGLSSAAAQERLVKYGRNELKVDSGPPEWVKFLRQFG